MHEPRVTSGSPAFGPAQLCHGGTARGTLEGPGIVVLQDDKNWHNAENLVPVVNNKWLEDNRKAKAMLEKLSDVLTTDDLKAHDAKVDAGRQRARTVAETYLKEKGLP